MHTPTGSQPIVSSSPMSPPLEGRPPVGSHLSLSQGKLRYDPVSGPCGKSGHIRGPCGIASLLASTCHKGDPKGNGETHNSPPTHHQNVAAPSLLLYTLPERLARWSYLIYVCDFKQSLNKRSLRAPGGVVRRLDLRHGPSSVRGN